eukprot:TRINITY_DN210_c0_g1_i1.p1 TRINITY_DN210_c0_g1~~TRINITY_DN210_c0_g1_i1.p1  ORF type:complete len:183 (+),score=56.43 TRINITY_DN210_c0_g1_i1:44-592(+)
MSVSPLQRKKLIDLFAVFDVNHSSVIDWNDYEELLAKYKKTFGLSDTDGKVTKLKAALKGSWDVLASADTNSDGKVSPVEFVKSYAARINSKDIKFAVDFAKVFFATLDEDDSGSIGEEEYVKAVSVYGVTAPHAKAAFKHLDVNGDGKISVSEIEKLTSEYFFSDNSKVPGNWLFGKDYTN